MPVPVHPMLPWIIAGIFAALTTGSLARLTSLRGAPAELVRQRVGSLKTWWGLAILLTATILFGKFAAAAVFVCASLLALCEYAHLNHTDVDDRSGLVLACLLVPVNYALICLDRLDAFLVFIPVVALFVLSAKRTLSGRTDAFIRTTARLHWGLLLLAYAPSHAVLLFTLPASACAEIGPAGWFLYLLILTEMNDIAQAFFGRTFGKRRIVPRVSPHKTWAGFVGGIVVTTALSLALASVLTPLQVSLRFPVVNDWLLAAAMGTVVAVFGFLGDINMSAIKRDIGVKDGSSFLPGQGGVIDRIDSLTFTAPVFYYFVVWIVV